MPFSQNLISQLSVFNFYGSNQFKFWKTHPFILIGLYHNHTYLMKWPRSVKHRGESMFSLGTDTVYV